MAFGTRLPVRARLKSSFLSVGDLARLTGVRSSAIRYYEACGLLPAARRQSGRRIYDIEAVKRVTLVIAARRLGFSISELRALSGQDVRAHQRAAEARAAHLRTLVARLTNDAATLEELSRCTCVSGGACRLDSPGAAAHF